MTESYLIIGGDKRQELLKNILTDKGKDVFHIRYPADAVELDYAEKYSIIVLPIPLTKDNKTVYSSESELKITLEKLYSKLCKHHKIYLGGELSDSDFNSMNFMKDKAFKKANAMLTSQGALRLLLDNTEDYIIGKKVLIIGFGDVAETLAELLFRIGCEVNITARNPKQLMIASVSGYKAVKLKADENNLSDYDYIFGTVPCNILTENDIVSMKDSAVYFELASFPFNADKELFIRNNKKYVFGSALPGRFLPEASARLIADFILTSQ